jgi:fatty-acyl-CoA synthase
MSNATGTLTVGNIAEVAAIRYGDRPMIKCVSTGRTFTFYDIDTRANRLANALTSLGFAKGDTVAFLMNNRAEIIEIYFALAKIGVRGMPINYRMDPAEIADLVGLVDAEALIFGSRFRDSVDRVRDLAAGMRTFIAVGGDAPSYARDYEGLLFDASAGRPETVVTESDPQYFNLTSGTTGSPKTYVLNHYNNTLAAMMMATQMELTSDDVVVTVFPVFGRNGFGWTLAAALAGATTVLMDFDAVETTRTIAEEKATITNLVPTMAQMLMNADGFDPQDFASLRGIVLAGSPLTPGVYDAVVEKMCPHIYEYYGMQELGIIVDIGPEEKAANPRSVGRPSFFCETRVVDSDGSDMGPNEDGAIIAQAPTATTGYFKNEQKTAETFRNGWVYTGDIGHFDDRGYLYVTGRAKDVIVTGGQNVFASEVEDRLLTHPGVADCAVIGVPDDLWGEMVTAVVITPAGHSVTEEQIIDYCKETLANFKAPKRVIWRQGPIPRTPTGKTTKYVLIEEYTRR